jgi:hypothetical protein
MHLKSVIKQFKKKDCFKPDSSKITSGKKSINKKYFSSGSCKPIIANVLFGDAKKLNKVGDKQICNCDPQSENPCSTNKCFNRGMHYECMEHF